MEKKFILMGIESNDIWQDISFFEKEDDGYGLCFAEDIWKSAKFTLEEAYIKRDSLISDYPGYTWHIVEYVENN